MNDYYIKAAGEPSYFLCYGELEESGRKGLYWTQKEHLELFNLYWCSKEKAGTLLEQIINETLALKRALAGEEAEVQPEDFPLLSRCNGELLDVNQVNIMAGKVEDML